MTGPGTATVTDDTAVAISTVLTPAVTAGLNAIILQIGQPEVPGTVLASLSEINANLTRIADQNKAIAKGISDLDKSIGTMAVATVNNNAIQAMLAVNQIKTNNFQTQVTKEALKRADLPLPKEPELKEQLKTAVEEGIQFNAISTLNGAVTSFINTTVSGTATWIAGTEAYKTVASYVTQAKDAVLAVELPSGKSIASILKTGKAPT